MWNTPYAFYDILSISMRFLTFFNTMLSQFIHPQNIIVIIKLCKLKCRCMKLCPESCKYEEKFLCRMEK